MRRSEGIETLSKIKLEVPGYGTFGNLEELRQRVEDRMNSHIDLAGDAEIFLGATIIRDEKGVRLENPRGDYPRIHVHVGSNGEVIMKADSNEFKGKIPENWEVEKNP